ncbi:MAG: M48 family metalloprotease [Lewinella sp.]
MRYLSLLIFSLLLASLLPSCGGGPDINIFPVSQDVALGKQTLQEIAAQPGEFPVLPEANNPAAYAYLQGMVDEIVRSGGAAHADVFPYRVFIIDKAVENAFATPGGYLFVYTGLVNTLTSADQLAGVLAHEIAHAAERHSTKQATQRWGLSAIEQLITGGEGSGMLAEIAAGLINLNFSRSDEAEADARSVDYLCQTPYAANGAAGFFEAMQDGGGMPEFFSTHPNPANRVQDINDRAAAQGCSVAGVEDGGFEAFKRGL